MYKKPLTERIGFRKPSVIPGFGLSLGVAVTWLTLIILIPLAAMVLRSFSIGFSGYADLLADPRTQKALQISFGCSLIGAIVNVIFGVPVAWVLVRYNF